MGEVAAGVEGHAEHALVAELPAQFGPVGLGEVVDVADLGALQGGALDPLGEHGPEGGQVGVDAGVRLDVGVVGAEEGAGVLGGDGLDGVDVAAAGVEAAAGGALGVLVAEPVAHGEQDGRGGVVLAGDELERGALVVDLLADGGGDPRFDLADHVEGGAEGGVGGGGGGRVRLRGHGGLLKGRSGAQALGNCVVIRHGAASRWSIPSVRASRGPPESYQCRTACGGDLRMRDSGGHDIPFVRLCPFLCYGRIAAE